MKLSLHSEFIRTVAEDELTQYSGMLGKAGLTWSKPELVILITSPSKFTAEIKIEFYQNDDLVDIFEFFVCDRGVIKTSENEVRRWMQENIQDVVRKQKAN